MVNVIKLLGRGVFIHLIWLLIFVQHASVLYPQQRKVQDFFRADTNFAYPYKNAFEIESFGHGLFYSLNYERILINHPKFKTSLQAGVSDIQLSGYIEVWIPLSINLIRSFGYNHVEFGIGQVFTYSELFVIEENVYAEWWMLGSLKLGYRYQRPQSRWLFKLLFTPFIEYPHNLLADYRNLSDYFIHPSGALSVGYMF